MSSKKIRKVIWAVDPFEQPNETQTNVVNFLQFLQKAYPQDDTFVLEPVYVLSSDQLNLPRDFGVHFIESYKPTALKIFEKRLTELKDLPKFKSPQVLTHQGFSLRSLAHYFIQYAESVAGDLIVVGTHGKKGLSRAFLGSFAESLLLQSHIPVLVIGPNATELNFNQILFPCDLDGEPTDSVFLEVLEVAHQLNAEVTLLHAIPRPFEPAFQSGVYLLSGAWPALPIFLEKEGAKRQELANQWKEFALKRGVNLHTIIEADFSSVSDSILKKARQLKVGMIMMEAKSGPISSALLGSTTREVIRSSSCPVWTLRSEKSK